MGSAAAYTESVNDSTDNNAHALAHDWFPIADLLRPQGRRGEMLADLLTDLNGVFQKGASVWLARGGEPAKGSAPVTLEGHWMPTGRNAGRVVLKLSAADSINEAELLSGQRVFLAGGSAPKLADDTFFVRDLIACTLIDHGTPVGNVVDVEFPTSPDGRTRLPDAAPLLVIALSSPEPAADADEPREALVPFIRAWITAVDLPNRSIAMELPIGLLGDTSSTDTDDTEL
jgi:16S rRNA processing protein RimM